LKFKISRKGMIGSGSSQEMSLRRGEHDRELTKGGPAFENKEGGGGEGRRHLKFHLSSHKKGQDKSENEKSSDHRSQERGAIKGEDLTSWGRGKKGVGVIMQREKGP